MQGDAFLLTSLWEGLPISLLEAMYMKKICIVSNVIGNRDVIHSNKNGYVCNVIDEYVQAIREIKDEDVTVLVENAYQEILNSYNTKIMAEHYKKIYISEIEKLDCIR